MKNNKNIETEFCKLNISLKDEIKSILFSINKKKGYFPTINHSSPHKSFSCQLARSNHGFPTGKIWMSVNPLNVEFST